MSTMQESRSEQTMASRHQDSDAYTRMQGRGLRVRTGAGRIKIPEVPGPRFRGCDCRLISGRVCNYGTG